MPRFNQDLSDRFAIVHDGAMVLVLEWHLVVDWVIWRLYALGWGGVNGFGGAVGCGKRVIGYAGQKHECERVCRV